MNIGEIIFLDLRWEGKCIW